MKIGDRVKVFDVQSYIDDKITPLSQTMKLATVIRGDYIYLSKLFEYKDEVVDVKFDDGRISKAHFIWAIELV